MKKLLILGTTVVLVFLYTIYSYNMLKGRSYIHEPVYFSIKATVPEYAKIQLHYQTLNDPTTMHRASQVIHDSIPEYTTVFEIDSSYRLANFKIYFQLLRENDEVAITQIKASNTKHKQFIFSLIPRDLIATENLSLIPVNNNSVTLRKVTKDDPSGDVLYFDTRGALGGIFVQSDLRMPQIPSLMVSLVILGLGFLIAYLVYPTFSRLEWRGISVGAFLLALAILVLPSGEKICNLLLAMAIVAGFISGIREGELLNRLRKNQSILLPIIIISVIYLVALSTSNGNPGSIRLLKIKFGLPMTLMAVALNTNNKKELRIQFIALLTGVIISVFTHLGWAFMLVDAVEVKSKLFSTPRFYLESSVFSRVHHSYLSVFYLLSLTSMYFLKDSLSLRKIDVFFFNLLILLGLLSAFSRATILALLIILCYYAFKKIFSLMRISIGPVVRIITVLLLATTLLLIVFSDFETLSADIQISGLSTRVDIWDLASDLIKQKPLTGWGPGAYSDALKLGNQFSSFNSNTWVTLNSHNQFLETSGMFGLLTALALAFFLFYPAGLKKLRHIQIDFILTVAIIFSTVFLFESFLNRNLGILVFGLSYGLLIKVLSKPTPFGTPNTPSK